MVGTFEFRGLRCFPAEGERDSFWFVPLRADLDRDEHGHPMFTLMLSGAGGFLMFTAVWRADQTTLDALRHELAKRVGDTSTIRLAFAPVRSVRCDLLLGDGSGQFQAVASGGTSGAPPYSTLFHTSLTDAQLATVIAAVNGRPGHLAVEYGATVVTPAQASGRLVARSPAFAEWMRDCLRSGTAGLRAAIEEAVTDGLATVELDVPEEAPAELVNAVYEAVLARACEVLPGMVLRAPAPVPAGAPFEGPATHDVEQMEVTVEVRHDVERRLSVAADLANLIDPAAFPQFALPAQETARPVRVGLGFDGADAPVAWVRLRRGDATAVLTPPRFTAVEVAGDTDTTGAVQVTTGYTDGTPTHRAELVPGGVDVRLTPGDLGLTRVSVDARPLARAGARSAQVWLTYQPPYGADVRRGLRFGEGAGGRTGDEDWTAHAWLATPAGPPGDRLTYRWSAVTGDGRVVGAAATPAANESIVLSLPEGAGNASDR